MTKRGKNVLTLAASIAWCVVLNLYPEYLLGLTVFALFWLCMISLKACYDVKKNLESKETVINHHSVKVEQHSKALEVLAADYHMRNSNVVPFKGKIH